MGNFIEDKSKHNYAKVLIRWKDSGLVEDVVFKLSEEVLEEEEGKVFCYCKDEAEYKDLIGYNNGKDYEIFGCTLYTEKL